MEPTFSYLSEIRQTIDQMDQRAIEKVIQIVHEARLNYQNVFIFGNGGSAATASHFVCDLAKNTRLPGCPDVRAVGLADNMAMLSAYANDEGYENVFAQQLKNLVRADDVVIAFSTSGNSPNVLRAVEAANAMGATTIGFTGREGGLLGALAQIEVRVPNQHADQIEDVHLILAHLISRRLTALARPTVLAFSRTNGQKQEVERGSPAGESRAALKEASLEINAVRAWDTGRSGTEFCELSALLLSLLAGFRATSGSLVLLDAQGAVIDSALAYTGQVCPADAERIDRFLHQGLAGWVVKHREGTLVVNTSRDKRWLLLDGETASAPRSVLCAPILKSDRAAGVIALARPETMPFTSDDLFILNSYSAEVRDSFDPCTG
ncbi:MAG TPA: SIS domain-containing protein, partial [Anaerolineaceae bacterium]